MEMEIASSVYENLDRILTFVWLEAHYIPFQYVFNLMYYSCGRYCIVAR